MLKVGVIGCGAIADAHAWAIGRATNVRIVAACDAEPLLAKLFCDRFNVPAAFTEPAKMIEHAKPDVVHILTPPQTHYALARQCLEQGCHTYVEKPFTLHTSEADELFALAGNKKLKLTVGHDAQFSPGARYFRELINSGYLGGDPLHLKGYYGYELGNLYGNAVLNDKKHWVRRLPGRLLQNVISHGIARIAEFMPGTDPQVIAHGFVSPALKKMGETEIIDELRVIISDPSGVTAYFTFSSQLRPCLNQFRVLGSKNGLQFDESQQTVIKLRGKRFKSYAERFVPPLIFAKQHLGTGWRNLKLFWRHDFHVEEGKRYLTQSFYDSILTNSPLPIPLAQIRLTSRIMDKIFEQISTPR